MIYGYPALYQPTAAPKEAPPVPDHRKALAKRAGASHISADGTKAYVRRMGDVLFTEWDGNDFDNCWWPLMADMPERAVSVDG